MSIKITVFNKRGSWATDAGSKASSPKEAILARKLTAMKVGAIETFIVSKVVTNKMRRQKFSPMQELPSKLLRESKKSSNDWTLDGCVVGRVDNSAQQFSGLSISPKLSMVDFPGQTKPCVSSAKGFVGFVRHNDLGYIPPRTEQVQVKLTELFDSFLRSRSNVTQFQGHGESLNQPSELAEEMKAEKQEDKYIERQAFLFDQVKESLMERYAGQYVLFEDGQVLDSGSSPTEVAMRAYRQQGMRPLFIEQVTLEPEVPHTLWTPFRIN